MIRWATGLAAGVALLAAVLLVPYAWPLALPGVVLAFRPFSSVWRMLAIPALSGMLQAFAARAGDDFLPRMALHACLLLWPAAAGVLVWRARVLRRAARRGARWWPTARVGPYR